MVMATMNISLPEQMRDWVLQRTADGEYANNSDYVRDLIRKDKQRTQSIQVLQDAITKGLKSGEPKEFNKKAFTRRMQSKP
jgi:antitoxin ParD1/3/4